MIRGAQALAITSNHSAAYAAGLGRHSGAGPRFTKTYEDIEPGLAAYVRDAIHANASRHGA